MILKIKNLQKGPMVITGHNVIKLIQDVSTPDIDLLVRESMQNSCDAIKKDAIYGKIDFFAKSFKTRELLNCIPEIKDRIAQLYNDEEYEFIAIQDSNTVGLTGEPNLDKSKTSNLYNLVYDIMQNKKSSDAGGTWGIGKSVYYRFGVGLCFYYSRTFENNKYINKLVGALIEDEDKDNRILLNSDTGVAFLGDVQNDKSIPVYDDKQIEEFLKIFGLDIMLGDKTGTAVIIPFINKEKLLSINSNIDSDEYRCWLSNVEQCLEMSVQRWYFARINNKNFNGKYIKVAINGKLLTFNKFFQTMQDMYKKDTDAKMVDITVKCGKLGTFIYKKFINSDLGIYCLPDNNPSPKYLVDSENDVDEKGLLFYLRKPGMVMSYDNESFGEYSLDDGNYLIGMFILNDELDYAGENLGQYFRASEAANHKGWKDGLASKFPNLSKLKPFKKICSAIKKVLSEFSKKKAVSIESNVNAQQKELGKLLLPPMGFGKAPTPPSGKAYKGKSQSKTKIEVDFIGANEENAVYKVSTKMNVNEVLTIELDLKLGSKRVEFEEWEKMKFTLPCQIERIETILIDEKYDIVHRHDIPIDVDFTKRRQRKHGEDSLYRIKGHATEQGSPYMIELENMWKDKIKVEMIIEMSIVDNKYSIGFESSIRGGNL